MSDPKQVIVIRKDLKMRRGKEIAQGSHASMAWLTNRVRNSDFSHYGFSLHATSPIVISEAEREWINGSFTKIVCQVPTERDLLDLRDRAVSAKLGVHLIQDAGRTEFGGVPTYTALAIGPDWAECIDLVTSGLALY